MNCLIIDAAGAAGSVGISADGAVLERFADEPRSQARLMLPLVQELLSETGLRLAELDAIVFGRGPGSFTGLRIAAGITQGLAMGADLPVIPVSNLAALAVAARREHGVGRVVAALDARMDEVYWAACEVTAEDIVTTVVTDRLSEPGAVHAPSGDDWRGAGSAWSRWPDLAGLEPVTPEPLVRPRDFRGPALAVRQAGGAVAAADAHPLYLRHNVAARMGESGHGR